MPLGPTATTGPDVAVIKVDTNFLNSCKPAGSKSQENWNIVSFCYYLNFICPSRKKWLHTHHDTHSQHQTTHIPLLPPPSETHTIPCPPKAAPWLIVLPLHSITTHIALAGGCNWIHDEDTVAAALLHLAAPLSVQGGCASSLGRVFPHVTRGGKA